MVITDYEYVKKSSFALLEVKLGLKEGDDDRSLLIFKLIHLKVRKLCQLFSFFIYNFISKIAKQKSYTYL